MTRQAAFALTPVARSSDPESSHRAGEKVTRSGERGAQQHITSQLVHRHPGLTSKQLAEIAVQHGLLDATRARYILGRRLPELVPMEVFSVAPDDHSDCRWYPVNGRAPRPGTRMYLTGGLHGTVRAYASGRTRNSDDR